ncbi:MAG: carbon monoxide dehydrogenase subunit G [Deltaproteobacteria bacterium]|nr:MAG: carbon monoxide dehydrogenase subunit G [Deltaproteobacteria bacterium]
MKLEGDYLFEAKVPEVWSALFDPVILAAVMPGCEKLDLVDGHYIGDIKVKVGPIQGKFTGKVDLQDKVEPESYTMIVDGRGAPGFVKATAQVKLAAEGDATRVHYDCDAQVGGKIASVGQRLLEASARAIVAQSLEGLHTNIKLRAAAYREAAAKQAGAAPAAAPAPAAATSAATPADAAPPAEAARPAVAAPPAEAARPAEAAPPAEAARPAPPAEAAPAEAAPAEAAPAEAAPAEAAPRAGLAGPAGVEASEATQPGVAKPEAATSTEAAGAEAGWSSEATVKTGAPSYIAVPPSDDAETARHTPPRLPGAAAAEPAVAFTPVKVKQSALANAVAKEVASTMFPRSVLVVIILIQALVIVWLLVRH